MIRLIIGFLVVLFFVCATAAQPKTIRVPQDQPTVQSGIDAAVDGDTVLVADGMYNVNLLLTKKIVLGSLYVVDGDMFHVSRTILNGGTPAIADSASVIRIGAGTDTTTQVIGFTIFNGKGTITSEPFDGSPWVMGGGIFFMPGAGARISHNVITFNNVTSLDRGTAGAGIGISSGGAMGFWIIEHNQIIHNVNTYQGVKPSLGASGGGGWLTQSGRFEGNVVSDNYGIAYTYTTGGGIEWGASVGTGAATVEFTNNLIENNDAIIGAGLLIYAMPPGNDYPICTLTNNIIANNTSAVGSANSTGSAAIHAISGRYTLVNNTITGNTGEIAIWVEKERGPLTFSLLNNVVWNPSANSEIYPLLYVAGSYNDCRAAIPGANNINSDPLFSSTHPDSMGWFRIGSPCIDGGSDTATVGGRLLTAPENDHYGHSRPVGGKPDIGAFEDGIWSGVGDKGGVIPSAFALKQNYPNPFNPSTVVTYELPVASHVWLGVYDLLGQEVAVLVNERKAPGHYQVKFEPIGLASGVYLYRLTAGQSVQTRRMIALK
jgi:hypothetical protein